MLSARKIKTLLDKFRHLPYHRNRSPVSLHNCLHLITRKPIEEFRSRIWLVGWTRSGRMIKKGWSMRDRARQRFDKVKIIYPRILLIKIFPFIRFACVKPWISTLLTGFFDVY
jgi:hypothetical protein